MSLRSNPAVARLLDGRAEPEQLTGATPIAVMTCDIGSVPPETPVVGGARRARVLIADGPDVVGSVEVPVRARVVHAVDVHRAIDDTLLPRIISGRVRALLEHPVPEGGWRTADLAGDRSVVPDLSALPTVSAIICTRDRPDDLARALAAIRGLDGLLEVIVVDNAPTTDETRLLVEGFTDVRYVIEERPGLDRARNRGLAIARGEIVAFTDDDAVVDSRWAISIAEVFAADAGVWAVTGLVVPFELDTPAQVWFERQGGFGRGYERSWHHIDLTDPTDVGGRFLGAGTFGTGANMAFRRAPLHRIGGFDPALDVGTDTGGGGDLNALFETLHHGGTLVYEPRAVVRHRHRRRVAELYRQMQGNGGVFAHVASSVALDPGLEPAARNLRHWYAGYFTRRFARSLMIPTEIPTSHVLAEIRSCLRALRGATYRSSQAKGRVLGDDVFTRPNAQPERAPGRRGVAVRHVDLAEAVTDLDHVVGYASTRIYVSVAGSHVGRVVVDNGGRSISRARLLDEIARHLGVDLLTGDSTLSPSERRAEGERVVRQASRHGQPDSEHGVGRSLAPTSVSVVIATLDRPDDLRFCLQSVTDQRTRHAVEVVVVDNNPDSGLTAPVVGEFPGVIAVAERRRGLSHARNAGIRSATGAIVAATDDDVRVPADWIERLTAPFERDDIMAVCGNVLPLELEQSSQIEFEDMEMLGKGDRPLEVGAGWFADSVRHPAPTWELGATANAAFRREIFDDPAIGLFDTALGAGTPSGCSEDSYLLYRVLRAGHTVVYEPSCWVSHRHRPTDEAMSGQLRSYYRGAVAHQLATVHHDGDLRGVVHIARVLRRHARAAAGATVKRSMSRDHRITELRGVIEGSFAYRASLRARAVSGDATDGAAPTSQSTPHR